MKRPCLTCGKLAEGSWCREHEPRPWVRRSRSSSHLASIHWERIRKMALVRDHYTCVHCGTMARVEVHHRVPVAEGGTDDLDNLEVCCPDCHKAEHRRLAAFEAE